MVNSFRSSTVTGSVNDLPTSLLYVFLLSISVLSVQFLGKAYKSILDYIKKSDGGGVMESMYQYKKSIEYPSVIFTRLLLNISTTL